MFKILNRILVLLIVILLICCVITEVNSIRIRRSALHEPRLDEINKIVNELKGDVVQLNNKLDNISTSLILNPYILKCVDLIKLNNSIGSRKCWKKIQILVQNLTKSNEILNETLETIIIDSYNGDMTKILIIAKFIGKNNPPKSILTTHGYKILLNEMNEYGALFTKEEKTSLVIESFTYRSIKYMLDTEGDQESQIFKQLPISIKNIILGKKVYLKNNSTGEYMYSNQSLACKGKLGEDCGPPKVLMGIPENISDSRYFWTFKPVMFKWNEQNIEVFYIENSFDKKSLRLGSGDGSLEVIDSVDRELTNTWAMFYVHLYNEIQVIIQCSYWGMKTLTLKHEDRWKIPKLTVPKQLGEDRSSGWILEAI